MLVDYRVLLRLNHHITRIIMVLIMVRPLVGHLLVGLLMASLFPCRGILRPWAVEGPAVSIFTGFRLTDLDP